jgi:hypothetical protein
MGRPDYEYWDEDPELRIRIDPEILYVLGDEKATRQWRAHAYAKIDEILARRAARDAARAAAAQVAQAAEG